MSKPNEKLEAIFEAAVALDTEAQRADYLNRACPDAELRREVESLLAAHDQPDSVFAEETIRVEMPLTEGPGTTIGRYKLLQKIGEGGMGVVYLAEQREPVKRRVALKIIKLGMDTRQVVARFEAERQALAMMDHPNIARVLDAGATESGRPYFVMELVQGVPITEYCDKAKLPAKERLQLFIQVCQAVQSAHQKGIIHRDLKPSNILVTLHHGDPMPKVIDFGIAKATNQKLTEKTLFTQHATMIGTPAYMSPEQAEFSSLDVDTRTDVYSLGVLLYELLTGSTPFPEIRLRSLGYGEMQRVIADEEPERPSTRLSTMAHEQKSVVATTRGADLAELGRQLRGDLDWVVMRCLEKDRRRRYETANGLAADIQRHLCNEPVSARPPSAAYRFQKAWKRNKVAFSAAAAVLVALIAGMSLATNGFMQARLQRNQAFRDRQVAENARANEVQQRKRADELAQLAETQRRRAEARAYAADINFAQRALEKRNLAGARQVLERHFPKADQADRPGWEWRYLWGQAQSDAWFEVTRQAGTINSLAVSADGQRMALTLLDGGLSVLDISDLRQAKELVQLPTDGLGSVAFSPDRRLLAYSSHRIPHGRTGQLDCVIRLWNAETKQITSTPPIEDRLVGTLAFLADGRTLAVLIMDTKREGAGTVELWRIPELERIASLPNDGDAWYPGSRLLEVTADQSTLVVASRTLQVIDLSTKAVRWSAKVEEKAAFQSFNCIALSPDGKTLFSAEATEPPVIRVWDVATGKELARITDQQSLVSSLAVSRDGRTLASGAYDQTIFLWDISDPGQVKALGRPLRGHRGAVWALVTHPDGKTLLSSSVNGEVMAWDMKAVRKETTTIRFPKPIWFEFDPTGRSLFLLSKQGRLTRRHGEDFQTEEHLFDVGKDFQGACRTFDGERLATGSAEGRFDLWDIPRRKHLGTFGAYTNAVRPEMFSRDSSRLVVEENDSIHEWDLKAMVQTRTYLPLDHIFRTRFSDDLRWFMAANFSGKSVLTETTSGQQTTRNLDVQMVQPLAFSRNGRSFAIPSWLGYVKVWETETFRLVGTFGDQFTPIRSANFSPDGRRLITTGEENMAIWDMDTQLELLRIEHPSAKEKYNDGQFSLNGECLVAWGPKDLTIWCAPAWEEIFAAGIEENREPGEKQRR